MIPLAETAPGFVVLGITSPRPLQITALPPGFIRVCLTQQAHNIIEEMPRAERNVVTTNTYWKTAMKQTSPFSYVMNESRK